MDIPAIDDKVFFRTYDSYNIVGDTAKPHSRIPTIPWILIQFRVAPFKNEESQNKDSYNERTDSKWETVSLRVNKSGSENVAGFYEAINASAENKGSLGFDNFFDNIDIEDSGGMLKCSMKLYDREFDRLESLIMQTSLAMQYSSDFFNRKKDPDIALLQFSFGEPQNINFRIRYGYADSYTGVGIIDTEDENDQSFIERVKGSVTDPKMVIRSPWFYFQMSSCRFITSESGLSANIEGFSIGFAMLDRMKIIQRFTILKGTPEFVLKQFFEKVKEASNSKIEMLSFEGENDKSELPVQWELFNDNDAEWKKRFSEKDREQAELAQRNKYQIEFLYGSEPKMKYDKSGKKIGGYDFDSREYMSIRQVLNKLCDLIPPKYLYENIVINNEKNIKAIFECKEDSVKIEHAEGDFKAGEYKRSSFTPIKYTYSILEQGDSDSRKIKIKFFYKKPTIEKQEYVRRYSWRNNINNIITQFSIMSNYDFAAMNYSIADIGNEENAFISGVTTTEPNTEIKAGATPKKPFNRKLMLVNDITDSDGTAVSSMVSNMNEQNLFNGTIEILGDPFYYFDSGLQPYQYYIYLDVKKDRNLYWDGVGEDFTHKKSYLTGFYVIKKIRHLLNANGFKTVLEVEKWPNKNINLS